MKTTIIVLLALLAVSVFFLASADSVSATEASLLGKGKFRNLKRTNHRGRKNRGLKKRRNFGRKHSSKKWRINLGRHKAFGGIKTLGRKNGRKFRKINRKGRKNRKVGRKNRKSRKNRKVRKNRKNRKIGRKFRNKGRK